MRGKKNKRSVDDRLKDIQQEILVAVASGASLPEVMSLLCSRAEQIAPKTVCSVIRVDSGGHLRPLAAPSLPEEYSRAIDGTPIGPMVGSCGSAASLRKIVEVTDIARDPRWAAYKDLALGLGLKACWSSPIKSHDGRVIGTFAFYFRTRRGANATEKRIVEGCVHLCALAIEHWQAHARVRRLAYADPLTGLGNRAHLIERAEEILSQADAEASQVALFYIDVDGFRAFNDARGSKVGDQLLCSIAARIRAACRPDDTIIRLGADEFLVLTKQKDARVGFEGRAGRLASELAELHVVDDDIEVKAPASIGVAVFPRDGKTLDALMGRADTALRQLRSSARTGYALYTPEMDVETRKTLAFQRDVANAVKEGQLQVVFQPQADAVTCVVKGFEALLRWSHPIHGQVSPEKFIPAAEASGAIHDIGAFVLRHALGCAAKWPKHFQIAVNVSPAQIVNADFAALVEQALAESGVSPSRLEIEVTESLFIYDSETAMKTLKRIKAMGVSVAIDDFGTGYSSLSTLRSFPFDRIKIDRSFIFDMVANRDAAAIVNSILGLGRALGRRVVAEGVETKEQLELLRLQGCNEIQGYLIGKPQPIEAYAHLVGTAAKPASRARARARKSRADSIAVVG